MNITIDIFDKAAINAVGNTSDTIHIDILGDNSISSYNDVTKALADFLTECYKFNFEHGNHFVIAGESIKAVVTELRCKRAVKGLSSEIYTVDDLIKYLRKYKDEFGNIPVYLHDEEYNTIGRIGSVTVDNDNESYHPYHLIIR